MEGYYTLENQGQYLHAGGLSGIDGAGNFAITVI